MPNRSDFSLLALHGLRLKGFAETSVISALVGRSEADVARDLDGAAASELAIYRDGRMTGWTLTPAGRLENERQLAEELDSVGGRDAVRSVYERFLGLNGAMLQVCTDWQVTNAEANELNDHTDHAYDATVIGELARIDGELHPLLNELVALLDRFDIYPDRFTFALDRIRAGDIEWFTKPIMESYHTVWFELHEDLLATLGIDRASEGTH